MYSKNYKNVSRDNYSKNVLQAADKHHDLDFYHDNELINQPFAGDRSGVYWSQRSILSTNFRIY